MLFSHFDLQKQKGILSYELLEQLRFHFGRMKRFGYIYKKCGEILGSRLNTIHNLYFYQEFMKKISAAIEQDALLDFAKAYYTRINNSQQ